MIDQHLVGGGALGDAVRAEHRGGEIVPGHDADVHDPARARDLGGGSGRTHAMRRGAGDLVGHDVVPGHAMAGRDQPLGEGLAHQAEADEPQVGSALCHGPPIPVVRS